MSELFAALFGALVGGLITFLVEQLSHRRDLTIALYGEFTSPDMKRTRILADEVFDELGISYIVALEMRKSSKTRPFTLHAIELKVGKEKLRALIDVLQFIEKVIVLYENNRLDRVLLQRTLGRYIHWWNERAIRLIQAADPHDEWLGLLEVLSRVECLPLQEPERKLVNGVWRVVP